MSRFADQCDGQARDFESRAWSGEVRLAMSSARDLTNGPRRLFLE